MLLKIYNSAGSLKLTASPNASSTVSEEVMGEYCVSAAFTHPAFVPLDVNDYAVVDGVRYKVRSRYRPRQKNRQTYEYNVKLYAPIHDAEGTLFLFQADGEVTTEFSYDGDPRAHLQLWVDNMNRIAGQDVWSIGTVIAGDPKTIEYRNVYCWDAAFGSNGIAATFNTEMWADGYVVNLCKAERGDRMELGYLQGLTGLAQEENGEVRFFTRLFPLGSTRNIDASKYGHARLQLPSGAAYVDKNTELYGIKDGYEEAAFAHIYPKYVGSVTSVRSEQLTNEEGRDYTVYYFKDSGMDFNPADYEIPDHVKMLSFQTGELAGRGDGEGAFQANWHEDTQEWEIINVYPDDSTQLPGGEIIPQVGDTYIPWNFTLPQEYIDAAEQAYAEAVDDFLATYSFDTKKYNGTTDRNYVEDNGTPLKVGWNVRLLSEEYFAGGHKDTRITKVVRKLNDLCQATVTCTDQIGTGWKKTMENQLGSLYYELARKAEQTIIDIIKTTDTKTPGDHNVYSALRSRLEFLSKTHPETMPFLMTFLDGIVIGEHGFAGGLAGFGAKIDKKGYGEMRGLRLWEWLEVPEIRCNRVEVFLGIKWRVPGAGIVLTCTPDTDAEGNTLSTGTCVLKLEDGELGAVALDDIALGIYHFQDAALNATKDTDDGKGNFTFSGFATTYFRITGVSGSDHGTFTYSLRPGHTVHPQPQMHFACYGNFTDTSRQASVYETRTYTRKLWKQNTWEIGPQNIAQQDGDLSNLNINGMSLEGYSAYLNSVYFTGQILQVKPDGTPVRTANDLGAWAAGHYDYYDRVSHDGCIWLCVNEGGTNVDPAEGSADWLKQVEKGADGEDGKSASNVGNWHTGLFVTYLGITRMGNASWQCIVPTGTSNPPLWTITTKEGNRILQTQDGGKTYGYILTGEENTVEYKLIARDGEKGLDGVGIPGKDGKTYYTWLRYADDAEGNGISNDPTGKAYIGISNNNESPTESNNPEDYTWALIKGKDGVGIPGKDGKTYYTWIAYSDNADGSGMYQQPKESTLYIGIAPNKETATESTNPADYVWSRFKGDSGQDGVSITYHGNWHTGLFVPYMGTTRMGGKLWLCTAPTGTSNPPCWTITTKEGNRILQTQDGGRTYGYILTGEYNTAEYSIAAQDGAPGADGKKGDNGLQGCILRRSEWKAGAEYRNDESLTSGTRYVDVALVRDANTATGWRAYKCRTTHTSSSSNAPGNGTYWEEFGINTTSIFTDVIIAKNASIDLMWGQQVAVTDDSHNPVAGLTSRGIGSNTNVCIFGGSITAGTAPFMVMRDGSMTSTKANITGTVNAVAGVIAGFSISGNSLTNVGFDNNAAVIFRNDTTKCFAGIGGNVFPATTGITCVGRFENCDTSDTWSWSKNVAVYLRAEGAKFNYAFVGTGNGVLDGMVEGFALQYVSSTGTTVHSTDISKGKYIVFYTASGTFNHLLPTRQNIQDTLGIDASRKFAVLLHYFTKYTAGGSTFLYGRTTDIGGANTDQYPYLYDHNGNNTRVQLSKGDSAQVLVVYDGFNFFAQLVNVRN